MTETATKTANDNTNRSAPQASPAEQVIALLTPLLEPMGYEVVHVELELFRHKVLRLFIDRLEGRDGGAIGIQDCVDVTKALDEPLDQIPEIEAIFKGPYELEVSSPGIDRPLRQAKDYDRFAGREARIHTYRPLTAEELENAAHQSKNPKQKNFYGVLKGMRDGKVQLAILHEDGTQGQKKAKKGKKTKNSAEGDQAGLALAERSQESAESGARLVNIPLPLISKANLEPRIEIPNEQER